MRTAHHLGTYRVIMLFYVVVPVFLSLSAIVLDVVQ